MSLKGIKQTQEHIDKRRKALIGIKRLPFTQEHKRKIGIGAKISMTGRKKTQEHKLNISKAKIGKISPKTQGSNHYKWKGGISGDKRHYRIKRRDRKKEAGGFHSKSQWETLKAQYNWTCPCCEQKEPEIKLAQDHIVPISKGGSDNIENIQPLCRRCNAKKHSKIIVYQTNFITRER